MIDRIIQFIYIILFRVMLVYWFLARPKHYGAYVGVWHQDRILIIKNSYKSEFTVPCGAIHRTETALMAAVRELAEEVNIHLAPKQLALAGHFEIRHEFKQDHVSFFEIHLDEMPSYQIDNREVTWARFLDFSEVKKLDLSPIVSAYLSQKKS